MDQMNLSNQQIANIRLDFFSTSVTDNNHSRTWIISWADKKKTASQNGNYLFTKSACDCACSIQR